MTDLTITEFGDTWINGLSGKTGLNYGSTDRVHVRTGDRRGLIRPALPNIAGRTVVLATLVGHTGSTFPAQTLTVSRLSERFSPGKVTWASDGGPAIVSGSGVTAVVGALAVGATVSWNVTAHIQAVADGSDWFGWRVSTNSSDAQFFNSIESGLSSWELHLTLSDAPAAPTDLRPQGGQIGDASPVLSWTFFDAGEGSTSQALSQVQVDTPASGADPDAVSPDYDSVWQTNVDPEWDLTGRHTVSGTGPHYWRNRVQDGDGNVSDWSDWADFRLATRPTLVIDSPTGPFGDPTPTLLAHLTGGTVASWSAKVTGVDRSDIRARTGTRTGPISWTLPLRDKDGRRVLKDDAAQWIYLRVYPTGNWATAVGQPAYVDAWIPTTWDEDLGIEAPDTLDVVQTGIEPVLRWQWTRAEAADGWVLQVDGQTIARLDPEDVDASGGSYTWVDNGDVAPMRPHELGVRAIDNGTSKRGPAATTYGWTHEVEGVWVLPDDPSIAPIQLAGGAVGDWARTDYRATYTTSTGVQVDIIYGRPGRTGALAATIDSTDGDDALWATHDAVEALAASKVRTARLVWASRSIPVRLLDVDVTPSDEFLPSNLEHVVRFNFVEVKD